MDIWYKIAKTILLAFLTTFVESIHVNGEENLLPGPKIIVANHPNATDSFVLPFIIPEKIHFLIQSEIFKLPIVGRLLALADQIPVVVGEGRKALAIAQEKLTKGNVVAIFPEGRLNHGKQFHRAGSGALVLASMSGAPVIPIGFYVPPEHTQIMQGRFNNRSTESRWQFSGRCSVQIGKPWRMNPIFKHEVNYRKLRTLTHQIMAQIEDLVRQAKESIER